MIKFIKKYPHSLWALYVPLYLAVFFLTEKFIATDGYINTALPIDSKIPFLEGFVIPYCVWYPFMFSVGIYLIFNDAKAFYRYMLSIIIGFSSGIIFFILFPNGQDLRPVAFSESNIFTDMVASIYAFDTNTNVLPSLHVVGSLATQFAVLDSKKLAKKSIHIISWIITLSITASTVFIKQHAILDVLAGIALSIITYLIVYLPSRKNK